MLNNPELENEVSEARRKLFVWTAATTVSGAIAFRCCVHPIATLGALEWTLLALFTCLFGWISFSLGVAWLGYRSMRREDSESASKRTREVIAECPSRCAVLVPIYNEDAGDVFARVEAMAQDLHHSGAGGSFDFYVLSDSTDAERWLDEELAWADLVRRLGQDQIETTKSMPKVFYRRRPINEGRKAGNIADFCSNWAGHHRFMVVLDADSLMAAATMIEMVRRMNRDDRLGILQVAPRPVGRKSLLARIQQFSAYAYGPIFVRGFDCWAGNQGNYWGHNAIIRIDAFRRHADLPILPGEAPLGGEILSHDFVEAALLVRSGWKVRLACDLQGSYEECPTNLRDYAVRDQRWCQGNLQHARLVISDGFRLPSRLHFLSGLMSYLSSPLWIMFLMLGLWMWATSSTSGSLAASIGRLGLFIVVMVMLLLPKCLGIRYQRSAIAPALPVRRSAMLETVLTILMAPLVAVLHTRFVIATLRGKRVAWNTQDRGDRSPMWRDCCDEFGLYSMVGVIASILVVTLLPGQTVWFAPWLASLIAAPLLAYVLGSEFIGRLFSRNRLLQIPEDIDPPGIINRYRAAKKSFARTAPRDSRLRVIEDPEPFLLHCRLLSACGAVKTADKQTSLKAIDALSTNPRSSLDELQPSEWVSIFSDPQLLRRLHLKFHCNSATPTPV